MPDDKDGSQKDGESHRDTTIEFHSEKTDRSETKQRGGAKRADDSEGSVKSQKSQKSEKSEKSSKSVKSVKEEAKKKKKKPKETKVPIEAERAGKQAEKDKTAGEQNLVTYIGIVLCALLVVVIIVAALYWFVVRDSHEEKVSYRDREKTRAEQYQVPEGVELGYDDGKPHPSHITSPNPGGPTINTT
ncbi:unnamed protein product, partial [Mesorhabditis spiculigera]